jgi:hypothetical protein
MICSVSLHQLGTGTEHMTPMGYRIAAVLGILLIAAACTKPIYKD